MTSRAFVREGEAPLATTVVAPLVTPKKLSTEDLASFLVLRTSGKPDLREETTFVEDELPEDLVALEEHLARALEKSVNNAIADARHVAVLTGGGVDSGALLALIVAQSRGASRKEVDALALHFGGPGDDRPYLKALCRDLALTPVRIEPLDAVPFLGRALRLGGAPDSWPTTAFEIALAMRAKALGADLIVGGFGGDHVFNGEGRDLALLAKRGHPIAAMRQIHALELPESPALHRKLADYLVWPLVAERVPQRVREWRRIRSQKQAWMGAVTLRFVERHFASLPYRRVTAALPRERFADWIRSSWRHELDTHRAALEREVSVARRNPYLDTELLRAVARIPPHCMLAGGIQKGLFRRAVARWIPENLRTRRDKAWLEPAIETFVKHPDVEKQLEELFDARELVARGLVVPDVERIIRDQLRRSTSAWVHLWPILSAEAWLRDG